MKRRTDALVALLCFWFCLFVTAAGFEFVAREAHQPKGWIYFGVGSVATLVTVRVWAGALPGILGVTSVYGVGEALSGHIMNDPAAQVSRSAVLLYAALLFAGGLIATRFRFNGSATDRLLLFGVVFSLASFGAGERVGVLGACMMTACLAVLWLVHWHKSTARRA